MEGSQEENPHEAEQKPVTLIGRVGGDAKFNRTQDKAHRTINFPLVVRGPNDSVDWHAVIMPEEVMKDFKEVLSKGDKIEVIGKIREGIKNGPKGGKPRRVKEFHASQIKFLK